MTDQDIAREKAEMEAYRRGWRQGWERKTIAVLVGEYQWFRERVERHPHRAGEDNKILAELWERVKAEKAKVMKAVENDCPIAFFKPSFEQAQVMNAWHPEFEPALAPEGYRSLCNFSSIRGGKTWSTIIDTLLWLLPNDPAWPIFEPYVDFMGREVRVLPRPDWDHWWKTGTMRPPGKNEPPKSKCVIWHGCPDEGHWTTKLDPVYRQWMPNKWVAQNGKDKAWFKADKYFITKFGSRVYGKLYQSDMQAWSGEEVWRLNLDEGPPRDKLMEAIGRSKYICWSYTSRDAANVSDRAAIAKQVHDGQFPLCGKVKILIYGMKVVPPHVMDPRDKAERIEKFMKLGEEGRIAVEGGFYNSSPNVFTHFKPEFCMLPVEADAVVRAIRGESSPLELREKPWLEKFRDANIVRGFDEGLAHPTATVWGALLRTGEIVIYRDMELKSASITERADMIIDLSGNQKKLVKMPGEEMNEREMEMVRQFAPHLLRDAAREAATGQRQPRYREVMVREYVRRTLADSKIFKRDPAHPMDDWTENYRRAGLRLDRARNDGPAARCDYVNGLFRPDHTRKHLNPSQGFGELSAGPLLYLTANCQMLKGRLENFLWGQVLTGARQGEPTGKPQETNDDAIDALSYVCVERMRWIDPSVYMRREEMELVA